MTDITEMIVETESSRGSAPQISAADERLYSESFDPAYMRSFVENVADFLDLYYFQRNHILHL